MQEEKKNNNDNELDFVDSIVKDISNLINEMREENKKKQTPPESVTPPDKSVRVSTEKFLKKTKLYSVYVSEELAPGEMKVCANDVAPKIVISNKGAGDDLIDAAGLGFVYLVGRAYKELSGRELDEEDIYKRICAPALAALAVGALADVIGKM